MNLNDNNKECAFCGEEFTPKRSDAKFCAESCKQKAYLSRKQAEIEDLQNQVLRINGHATDNDGSPGLEIIHENDTDSREMMDSITGQKTDTKETDNSKTTGNLLLKEAEQQQKPAPANRQFTDALQKDPDPHRMIEVTVNGKRLTVMKSLYEFLGDDYFKTGEYYPSEEAYKQAEKKKALERAKGLWSVYQREKVDCTNKQLGIWIRTLALFKRSVKLREVKAFLSRIEVYMKSSEYQYLPKEYEHKDFIENTFVPKIKRLAVSMEVEGNRHIKLVIDEAYQKQLEEVLLTIW